MKPFWRLGLLPAFAATAEAIEVDALHHSGHAHEGKFAQEEVLASGTSVTKGAIDVVEEAEDVVLVRKPARRPGELEAAAELAAGATLAAGVEEEAAAADETTLALAVGIALLEDDAAGAADAAGAGAVGAPAVPVATVTAFPLTMAYPALPLYDSPALPKSVASLAVCCFEYKAQ